MRLINHYLPHYHFQEKHQLLTHATPAALLDTALRPEISEDPWTRRLIQLRELPDRVWGALGGRSGLQQQPAFGIQNFTPLGRDGDQEVAIGLVGKFWQTDYGQAPIADAEAFTQFTEPGIAKLVLNFSTEATGDGTTWLRTETRVFCNDRTSLQRFTPYWWLIRPVSGLIRMRLLAWIRDAAHAS